MKIESEQLSSTSNSAGESPRLFTCWFTQPRMRSRAGTGRMSRDRIYRVWISAVDRPTLPSSGDPLKCLPRALFIRQVECSMWINVPPQTGALRDENRQQEFATTFSEALAKRASCFPGCEPSDRSSPRNGQPKLSILLRDPNVDPPRLGVRRFWNAQLQHALGQLRRHALRVQFLAEGEHAPEAAEAYFRVARFQALGH